MMIKLVDRRTEGEAVLIGRLDAAAAPETDAILGGLTRRFSRLVLNLAGLEYITSDGMEVLKRANAAMQQKGGELAISHPKSAVLEVLELSGVTGWLEVV